MKKRRIAIVIIILLIIILLLLFTAPVLTERIITRKSPNPEIIFSDVLINGIKDSSILEDKKTLNFKVTLKDKGEKYKIEYKVSNKSKKLESKVEIKCSEGNEFLSVVNDFDTDKRLSAGEVRKGTLTIELKKVVMKEQKMKVKCVIKETQKNNKEK